MWKKPTYRIVGEKNWLSQEFNGACVRHTCMCSSISIVLYFGENFKYFCLKCTFITCLLTAHGFICGSDRDILLSEAECPLPCPCWSLKMTHVFIPCGPNGKNQLFYKMLWYPPESFSHMWNLVRDKKVSSVGPLYPVTESRRLTFLSVSTQSGRWTAH